MASIFKGRTAGKLLTVIGTLAALLFVAAGCNKAPETAKQEVEKKVEKAAPKEVTVYSARIEELIKPVFDAFTEETGIKVRFTTAKEEELFERMKTEGANTPADMLITVDAGNLWLAAEADLLQPISSEVLEKNIPGELRDPDNQWFGLSMRARPIMYSKERVKPEQLSTYEALADPSWNGRLGLRSSGKVYTQSLIASMISSLGASKAEEVVKGWMSNTPVIFDSDTKMIEAIEAGQIDVAVANTYYLGRIIDKGKPDFPVAVFWPNQAERGAHVNVSGAGISKYAPNREAAVELLEWLSGPKAQKIFADVNHEYPVNPEVEPHAIIAGWGEFKRDTLNVAELGRSQAEAVKMADRAGYR